MSLTYDTGHAAEARDLLCQQFKGNAAIEALLNSSCVHIQLAEDAIWELQTERLPATAAIGAQLDALGTIVGQIRGELDDTHYRYWLLAKLIANASGGEGETLLEIIVTVTNNANALHLMQQPPAGCLIWIDGGLDPTIDPSLLALILSEAVAGGVKLQFVYSMYDNANTFTFASADLPEVSTIDGFSSGNTGLDPETGGHWADIMEC